MLVAGGAGAVGHAAIQLARWAGATVVTTVSSPEKGALATAAGAHHVVNYRADDAAAAIRAVAPDGVDIVVEVAPVANAELDAAVIARGGTVAIYASEGDEPLAVPVRPSMTANVRYQFILVYTMPDEAKRRAVRDVSAAVSAGVLDVGEEAGLPLHRFPLERTGDAHAAVEAGAVGKVLIDVDVTAAHRRLEARASGGGAGAFSLSLATGFRVPMGCWLDLALHRPAQLEQPVHGHLEGAVEQEPEHDGEDRQEDDGDLDGGEDARGDELAPHEDPDHEGDATPPASRGRQPIRRARPG